MRWLLAAVLLATGLTAVAPPADAAEPRCPARLAGAVLDDDPLVGSVRQPESAELPWTFDCVYVADDGGGGSLRVSWYEGSGSPCDHFDDRENVGTMARQDVDAGASYGSLEIEPGPMLAGLRRLAEDLMAAVAPRAAPCVADGGCEVVGTVTDDQDRPVTRVRVDLVGPGVDLTTVTDATGRYRFEGYAGAGFDPATDSVQVRVVVEQPGEIEVRYAGEPAYQLSAPFPVADLTECHRDFSAPEAGTEAVPAEAEKWPALWAVYDQVQRAFTFTTEGLGQPLDVLPVVVQTWCETVHESCADGGAFHDGSSTLHDVAEPAIYLGAGPSMAAVGSRNDTIAHEFGHHVMGDAMSDRTPLSPQRVAHGGYYGNTSSNDSWVEGFATFFAVMLAKHGDRDGRVPAYRHEGGSEQDLETNQPAWSAQGWHEEASVSGLLIDLEDSSRDYLDHNPPTEPADVVTKVITTPDGRRVVVGKIRRLAAGSLALLQLALYRDGERVRTLPIWIDGGPDDLRSGDGVVFWSVLPASLEYDGLFVQGLQERSNDDDPFDLTLAEVWQLVTTGSTGDSKPGKPPGYGHIYDVHELYQVLAAAHGGPDLDALFIEHGLFGDLDGDQSYDDGEPIGMTSHPALDAGGLPAGDAVERFEPDPRPAQLATVDSGGVDASYIVFTTFPEDRATASRSYLATPDGEGRIAVLVPPEASGGTATILALAGGHLPEVVAEIGADEFWADAARRPGESFLAYDVRLEEGEVTVGDEPGFDRRRVLLVAGGALLLLATALLLLGRRRALSGRRS